MRDIRITRRTFLAAAAAGTAGLLLPRLARADHHEGALAAAMAASPLVYVSPLKKDGSESTCHGEVWFVADGKDALVVTAHDRWKARSVAAGLDRARLWVGDFGVWTNADGKWKTHEGSVGRHWSGGKVHFLDEDGSEITEPRKEGAIYFEAPPDPAARFKYHKDDAKTAGTYRGDLFTIGDIGYQDEEGYVYLTDRQSNMIISGGVNIYPQETENHLVTHPKVHDVAVIGVPNADLGEEVKAVVVPAPGATPGPELEHELIEHCRKGIAHYKCPRTVDFVDALPRTETGKMQKRKVRDRYWEGRGGKLV